MARLRGRAPRGEPCRAGVPHGHWKTTTFTGALRLTGMTAPLVYDGAMNGAVFPAYVEQVLIETLAPGDIVVMDNLPAHKATASAKRSRRRGRGFSISRPIARTSIRSKTLSPSSRRSCVPKPSGPFPPSGMPSDPSSIASRQPTAQTTSKPPDMNQIEQDML